MKNFLIDDDRSNQFPSANFYMDLNEKVIHVNVIRESKSSLAVRVSMGEQKQEGAALK